MRTHEEMDAMQWRLDADRAALAQSRDYIAQWQRNFGYSEAQITTFTDAADRLIALNDYRGRGIGWTDRDPEGNERFKQLRRSEQEDRAAVSSTLSGVAAYAENSGRPDAQEIALYLRGEHERFESVPGQQQELYEARREHAEVITRSTKEAIPYSANQIIDFADSGGQSFELYRDYVIDEDLMGPAPDTETWIGQTAVLGGHFGTGTSHEHSAYAFTEAHKQLPGTQVTMAIVPPEHGMVVLGPPNCPESAHIDTWPLDPRVTSPETYGIDNIQEGSVVHQAMADGRDFREEAQPYLYPLPLRPKPVPRLTFEEAVARVREQGDIAEEMHHITRTTSQRDSDSDRSNSDEEYGHTLSRQAFTVTVANNFQIQPPSRSQSPDAAQARLASAANELSQIAGQGRGAPYGQGPAAGQQQWVTQQGRGLPPGTGGVGTPRPRSPSPRGGR
ncbi:hypothetical protein [Streptomyces axinellae]|uniref:Uncharacterized protein n=1 Tax=Streptomyces axinellae TaxID=552788 RepID=A0ABP6C2W0_9ACTN